MCLPGDFSNEAHAEAGVGVGAAEGVDDKQAFARQLVSHQAFQVLPGLLGERLVVVLAIAFIRPPHGIASGIVTDDIFIFRRTAGENAGIDGDGAKIG